MSRQSLSPEMIKSVKDAILHKMVFALGVEPRDASKRNWLNAALRVVRDLSTEEWLQNSSQPSCKWKSPCLLPINGIFDGTYFQ